MPGWCRKEPRRSGGVQFMVLALIAAFVETSWAADRVLVTRFDAAQIQFKLQNQSGGSMGCAHTLLQNVPWWSVRCGDRLYTVNTWYELMANKTGEKNLRKLTLMFDLSEGVASSGEKLVQFRSHLTNIVLRGEGNPLEISSSLDVQNGQASLEMQVSL